MQHDITWTIAPQYLLKDDNPASDAISRFYDAFAEILDTVLTLEGILPFYGRKMPYNQCLFANALSRSIRGTIILGDRRSTKCQDWHMLHPKLDRMLLSHKD